MLGIMATSVARVRENEIVNPATKVLDSKDGVVLGVIIPRIAVVVTVTITRIFLIRFLGFPLRSTAYTF